MSPYFQAGIHRSIPTGDCRVSKETSIVVVFDSCTAKSFLSMTKAYTLFSAHTFALRMYSLIKGREGCSRESRIKVKGEAESLRLKSFEIRRRLCVLLCPKFAGAI